MAKSNNCWMETYQQNENHYLVRSTIYWIKSLNSRKRKLETISRRCIHGSNPVVFTELKIVKKLFSTLSHRVTKFLPHADMHVQKTHIYIQIIPQ